jgi:hypothetical protein
MNPEDYLVIGALLCGAVGLTVIAVGLRKAGLL